MLSTCRALLIVFIAILSVSASTARAAETGQSDRMNIVFILSDDHRYDVMSFLDHPFVETPAMDAMARDGVYFKNAMVTTSLCSPSRASILTGQYMHQHGVVDNNVLTKPGTVFFPQLLQQAGYATGYFGKWHMGGHSDAPRPGFDQWVSFRGQGHYYPPKHLKNWRLNVNGEHVPQQGYITDELTDFAVDWLDEVKQGDQPFFMYLSHKGVHGMFHPAERHAGRYKGQPLPKPSTMANTDENYEGKPLWLKNQRNSWHGVEFAYHQDTDIAEHYRLYCEALLSVDESIARVRQWLEINGVSDNTLVMYMGDNGFQWGEHGLIDKRTAYEASIRVPLLGVCPNKWKPGTVLESSRRQHRHRPHLPRSRWRQDTRQHGRPKLPRPRSGRPRHIEVAKESALRILLGVQLPADTDHVRPPLGPLQIHPIPRHLGHRRTLRPPD